MPSCPLTESESFQKVECVARCLGHDKLSSLENGNRVHLRSKSLEIFFKLDNFPRNPAHIGFQSYQNWLILQVTVFTIFDKRKNTYQSLF